MNSRKAGIILSYTNTVLNMVVGLFLSAFLIRMLGDTEYGLYQTMSSFANYLVLLEFGTGTVMTRNLSVCRNKENSELEINKNISTIWTEMLILIAVIVGISIVFYFSIDSIYSKSLTAEQIQSGKNIFIFVTLYLVFSFGIQTLNGIILAFERYTYNSLISIARQVVRVTLLVSLILRWRYALIIAVVDFALGSVIFVVGYLYCKRKFNVKFNPKYFDKAIFKASLPLSLAIFIQGLSSQANSNVGKFIIGIEFSPETVAIYSVAIYITQILSSLGTVPVVMYTPQIAKNVTEGIKGKTLMDTLIEPCRLVTIICGTVFFGLVTVGRQFIDIIYGAEYLKAWTIVIVVALPMVIQLTNAVMENVLNTMNRTKPRTISLLLTTTMNIVLTILFMKLWGIIGVAIASAISIFFFQATFLNIYYSKCLDMNMIYLYKNAYKGIVPYQVIGTVCALVVTNFISNNIVSFLVGGVIYVAVSFGGILMLGINETEKELIRSTVNKLTKKQEHNTKENIKMSLFKDKTLMITGGTGSFGNAVLNRFLKTDIGEIRIFSRDEKKQDDMRHEFQAKMPEVAEKIKFYIGDVRDIASVRNAMHGVDYIFHAAALKQVPSCEFFPIEAVKTNVLGTENVLTAAIEAGVENIVCLSTDKAAYPVNAMGTSKAMMEKVIVAKSRTTTKTKICCTRYGNVMCSRGSVIPLWIDQIRAGNPITVTDPNMTRFIMSLDEAVDLVLFAFEHGKSGDILVQKAPACTIATQAQAVINLFDKSGKTEIKVIGIRHGEKMYETLLTNEECANAIDMGNFYRVPCDSRGLNYDKYFKHGDTERNTLTEFNSNNTQLLDVDGVKEKLLSLEYIREEIARG